MKISQSLIKECMNPGHCPKQIYFSFVEGKDLLEPSENMLLGRYFESELLGACRGGEIQEAKIQKNGSKYKVYSDCDELIVWAEDVLALLGLNVKEGESQVQCESELLSGNIDHVNKDLIDPSIEANYDLKWTATKEDDIWNGWGDPDSKGEAKIQASHYTLLTYEITGEYRPFYFLVFGKDKWVKVLRFKITEEGINHHKQLIANTAAMVREYAENNYKGNGNFNKCQSCPFNQICPDRALKPEIENIYV